MKHYGNRSMVMFFLSGGQNTRKCVSGGIIFLTTCRSPQDSLLDAIFSIGANNTIGSIISGMLPPGLTDYDKFGWFYKVNKSRASGFIPLVFR